MRRMLIVGLAAVVAIAMAGDALAAGQTKRCSYTIMVKSKFAQLGSTPLPNGRVVSEGNFKIYGSFVSDKEKRWAYTWAGRAAKRCLNAAVRSRRVPPECRHLMLKSGKYRLKFSVDSGWFAEARMIDYRLPNLKRAAIETICTAARANDKGRRQGNVLVVERVHIWVRRNPGQSKRCNLDDNEAYSLIKGLSVRCGVQGAAIRPGRASGFGLKTGYHDESVAELRERIKAYCLRRYSRSKFRISAYEVQQRTGKRRAVFSCLIR